MHRVTGEAVVNQFLLLKIHCDERGLETYPQMPTLQPFPLFFSQKWGKPVQKQLFHGRLPKVLHPTSQPTLESIRGIGPQRCDEFIQQEQRNGVSRVMVQT